jgi:adenosylhomocysteine nucleosidase
VRTASRLPEVIAVTGLAFEARIAAGAGVRVICAGNGERLRRALRDALSARCSGIISFGLAGGLDPDLKCGHWIVADAIIGEAGRFETDRRWTGALMQCLANATPARIAGSDAPLIDPAAKRALQQRSGAAAVDMESHIAADIAQACGVPFAACRVIIDAADRTLPPAALAAQRSDGSVDITRVAKGVLLAPSQVPAMLRLAFDARVARASLARGRRLLGASLGFPDFSLL